MTVINYTQCLTAGDAWDASASSSKICWAKSVTLWTNLGEFGQNLRKFDLDKIKILHPQKHTISYGYDYIFYVVSSRKLLMAAVCGKNINIYLCLFFSDIHIFNFKNYSNINDRENNYYNANINTNNGKTTVNSHLVAVQIFYEISWELSPELDPALFSLFFLLAHYSFTIT